MSKLDIQITFDRQDRTYRGNEMVSGQVAVRANQDVNCRALTLSHYWQTHGRGNKDKGDATEIRLAEGMFSAGQTASYPFRFTAPAGPATYHGHYLNIDHYVEVRADVPWGFDPKTSEEFFVVAGDVPDRGNHLPTIGDLDYNFASPGRQSSHLGTVCGGALILVGILCFFPLGLVLIPVGLFVLWWSLRNILAERKLGEVELDWGGARAAPGNWLEISLEFTPRKPLELNSITARLTCDERCTSGSGTNKTTHTHDLVDTSFTIAERQKLAAYTPVQIRKKIPIPEIDAHSFEAVDNKIRWELGLRIDIPTWPDWKRKIQILVLPQFATAAGSKVADPHVIVAELAGSQAAGDLADADAEVSIQPAPPPEMLEPGPPPLAAAAAESSPAVAEPTEDELDSEPEAGHAAPALKEVCRQIKDTHNLGDERREILDGHRRSTFACTINIDRISESFGYEDSAELRDGKTVVGYLAGTTQAVLVNVRRADRGKLDGLGTGDQWQTSCQLADWDHLYERAVLKLV